MTFDEAFKALIGHEGGYVDHPARVEYVDDSKIKTGSRKPRENAVGTERRCAGAITARGLALHGPDQFAVLRMPRARLRSSGLRRQAVQCPLHPAEKRRGHVCSCAGQQTRRALLRVLQAEWKQGRLGDVPNALSSGALRGAEGCGRAGVRRQVHGMRRAVPPGRFRLSPLWGQARIAEPHVYQYVSNSACERACEVQIALRELPQIGAL